MDSHIVNMVRPDWLTNPEYCMQNWTFTDWDGSSHSFNGTRDCSMGDGEYFLFHESTPLSTVTSTSVDPSYFILDATNSADIRVIKRDGSVYHFGGYNASYAQPLTSAGGSTQDLTQLNRYSAVAGSIVDHNGSTISINGGVITDTIGRTITITTSGNPTTYSISYKGPTDPTITATAALTNVSSQVAAWPFQYPVNAPNGQTGACVANYVHPNYNGNQPPTVTYDGPGVYGDQHAISNTYTITLPNSSTYKIVFDMTGNVIQIIYPTGGYTKYDYAYGRIQYKTNFADVSCTVPSNELLAKHECSLSSGSCIAAAKATAANSCTSGHPAGGEATSCYSGIYGQVPGVSEQGTLSVGGTSAIVIDPEGNKHGYASFGNYSYSTGGDANNTSVSYYVGFRDVGEVHYAGQTQLLKTIQKSLDDSQTNCNNNTFFNEQPCAVTTTIGVTGSTISTTSKYQYDQFARVVASQDYDYDGSLKKSSTAVWNTGGIYSPSIAGSSVLRNVLDSLSSLQLSDAITGKILTKAFEYDSKANLTKSSVSGTDIPAVSTSYPSLDVYGRPTQAQDPRGNVTSYEYVDSWSDSTCAPPSDSKAYLTKVTSALSQSTTYKYDSCKGLLGSVTDPNGRTKSFDYDNLGRVLHITYPDGGLVQETYNDSAPYSIQTTEAQSANKNVITSVVFDGLARPVQNQLTSGDTIYTDTTYDALGRVATLSNQYRPGSPSPTDGNTQFFYDALGQKTLQVKPDGTTLQWCFNGMADPQHPQSNCRSNLSDFTGSWVDSADGAQNNTQHIFDAAGRLRSVIEPGMYETDYAYSGVGDLMKVDQWGGLPGTAGERLRSFTYDSLSRLLTSTNSETGTICYGTTTSGQPNASGSNCNADGYDANGNLLHKTDANGTTLHYNYDALNRLVTKTSSPADTSTNATLTYDEGTNGIGRLTTEFTPDQAGTKFSYDAMGRVSGTQWWAYHDALWHTGMQTQYDLAGNPTQLTYPDNFVVNQAWDGAGRLGTVTGSAPNGSGYTFLSGPQNGDVQYGPSGAVQNSSYGGGSVAQSFTYNNRLQPCRSVASGGGSNLLDRQIFYNSLLSSPCGSETNNNGNIASIVDNLHPDWSQGFSYDSLNRLHTASRSDGVYNHTYNYDSFGNMLLQDHIHTSPNYSIEPSTNRLLLNGTDYAYNPNGTLASLPGSVFMYTAEDRLRCINGCPGGSYLYNSMGERSFADRNGLWSEYVYLNGQPLAIYDFQINVWHDYIYGNGRKIAKVDSVKPLFHMHGVRDGSTALGCGTGPLVGDMAGSIAGQVIRSGDKLAFDIRQMSTGSTFASYFGIIFQGDSPGADRYYTSTGLAADQNGNLASRYSLNDGQWHHSVTDLSQYAGAVMGTVRAGEQGQPWTGSGIWDIWIANAVVLRADGSILPMFTGQPASVAGIASTCGGNSQTFQTESTPVTDPAVNTSYYLADHLGTTQMELSSGGWPVWQGQFAPFGQELDNQNTTNRFKFTGKERDTESGLDYFGARYYGSNMGRWMSPDWAAKAMPVPYAKLDNPQTLNLYAYVGNNPLSHTDADGHYECAGTKAQCAAIKTGLDAVRAADAKLKDGTSGKALLDKALKFYGAENTKNGVEINFNNQNDKALGSTSTKDGITTISFGAKALDPLTGTGKGETVAHEGTHGVDQQKNGMPHGFWGYYGTEYHAYQAESAVDKGLGVPNETDERSVWFPGISQGQRTTAITRDAYSNAVLDCENGGCQ